MDKENKQELRKVQKLLGDIKENTEAPAWRMFRNGLLYGAGGVVGTIVAIVAGSWLLSLFGIVPGIGQIASQIQSALEQRY